ncbi:MAG: alkane 1-monooxygenase [Erythrobacter sp.]|nr:alkane 1-monooxygenase [Erythrobacter sp.]
MAASKPGIESRIPSYIVRLVGLAINAGVPLAALYAILSGAGWWSVFLVPAFFLIAVPLIDLVVGERCFEAREQEEDRVFDLFLYVQVPFHFLVYVGAVYAAVTVDLPLWARIVAVVGFGLVNGQCTLIGHEFAHKTGKLKRLSAQVSLAVVGMGHFMLEHVRGHHIHVATPEDCASARLGESIYAFALRDMVGEIAGGNAHEAQRLRKNGKSAFSAQNRILQSYALTLATAAILVVAFGWAVLPWIVLHHVSAWFTLTLFTYIEHYGLLRAEMPNGRREPVQRVHTWNTDAMVSNMLLLNVQRHSDHHAKPMKPYQSLRDEDDGPRLPSGYFGMIVLALIPPLWRLVMDTRAVEAVGGNSARLHIVGPPSRRILRLLSHSGVGAFER